MQALSRPLAIVLALVGAGTLAWVGVTLAWGEPFTAVSAARSQAALRSELESKLEGRRSPGSVPAGARRRAAGSLAAVIGCARATPSDASSCRDSTCARSWSREPGLSTSPAARATTGAPRFPDLAPSSQSLDIARRTGNRSDT